MPYTGKHRFMRSQLLAIREYLRQELVQFENAASTTRRMIAVNPLPQLHGQLEYYNHAVGCVKKLLSDTARMVPIEDQVQHANRS